MVVSVVYYERVCQSKKALLSTKNMYSVLIYFARELRVTPIIVIVVDCSMIVEASAIQVRLFRLLLPYLGYIIHATATCACGYEVYESL